MGSSFLSSTRSFFPKVVISKKRLSLERNACTMITGQQPEDPPFSPAVLHDPAPCSRVPRQAAQHGGRLLRLQLRHGGVGCLGRPGQAHGPAAVPHADPQLPADVGRAEAAQGFPRRGEWLVHLPWKATTWCCGDRSAGVSGMKEATGCC
jgi:hypothetical protein